MKKDHLAWLIVTAFIVIIGSVIGLAIREKIGPHVPRELGEYIDIGQGWNQGWDINAGPGSLARIWGIGRDTKEFNQRSIRCTSTTIRYAWRGDPKEVCHYMYPVDILSTNPPAYRIFLSPLKWTTDGNGAPWYGHSSHRILPNVDRSNLKWAYIYLEFELPSPEENIYLLTTDRNQLILHYQ